MSREIAEAQWKQIKGKIHQFWGRVTEDEVEQLDGRYETLAQKVQEKYGLLREDAEDQVRNFLIYCQRDRSSYKEETAH